jgi:hypothetical protein
LDFTGPQSITTTSGILTLDPATNVHIANNKGLVVGHTAQLAFSDGLSNSVTSEMQVLGTGTADGGVAIAAFATGNARSTAPLLTLMKSGQGTIGSTGIVADDEVIGAILFNADDGTDYLSTAAAVQAEVDGSPGANDMPGRLIFATTADGSQQPTERMRIDSSGNVTLAQATTISNTASAHNAVGYALTISSGDTTAGTTDDIAGGALTIQGGQGKGSGAGGDIIFQTANAGSSGSSVNSLATALTISDDLSSTFAGIVDVSSASRGFAIGNLGGTERIAYLSSTFSFLTDGDANAGIAGGDLTIDGDLDFTGPQEITTSSGTLTLKATTDTDILRASDGVVLSLTRNAVVGWEHYIGNTALGSGVAASGSLELRPNVGNVEFAILQAGTTNAKFTVNSSLGNTQIGGTADHSGTVGTNILSIFDGTAPVNTLANGCSFYSTSGEMRVMDAGGTATLLSPHDSEGYWVFDSTDTVTGKRLVIHMEKLMRALEAHFGWGFIEEFTEEV